MNQKNILGKYENKALAVESFGNNKKVYADGFIDGRKLMDRLYELDCHKLSLTDDGLNFLKDYYGLNQVADMIMTEISKGLDFKYETKEDIERWLEAKGELLS